MSNFAFSPAKKKQVKENLYLVKAIALFLNVRDSFWPLIVLVNTGLNDFELPLVCLTIDSLDSYMLLLPSEFIVARNFFSFKSYNIYFSKKQNSLLIRLVVILEENFVSCSIFSISLISSCSSSGE